ncbi:MAG TPA: C40 family peptidase [Bacteroidales bacterium]|nr:C40 family peptidase [Bacteroidales bacterium]
MRAPYVHGYLLMLAVLLFSPGCEERKLEKIRIEIENISDRYVPDSRTDIGAITLRKGGGDTLILKGETTVEGLKNAVIKSLDNKGYTLKDSIILLPDTSLSKKYFGLATLSVINIRKLPDHSSELVSQSLTGTPLIILKTQDSWALVRTPDKYIGWTEMSSLRAVTPAQMNEWKNSDRIVFEESTGWIYSNPAETGITSDVVAGCILSRIGETDTRARVVLPDGREGFVNKSSIIPFNKFRSNKSVTGDDIVSAASALMGVPYMWGGSSAKGVDCSGLVQRAFFMNGIILARDASQQALHGDSIPISKDFNGLLPGDLLFFGAPGKISHVAIYKGGLEYIHSSGRVMVNSLDPSGNNFNSYRKNSLVKAMRILNSIDPGIVAVDKHPLY